MSLKDLALKKSYDSDSDDILNDFYILALSQSVTYKRLAGFFSSSALAVAARGISKLISNGGHMKLIASAKLRKSDIEAIREAYENPEKVIEKMVLEDLENLEDKFVEDHVRALGWMVAKKKLEIKIAIVYGEDELPLDEKSIEKQGIFHQKVGIFEDERGNQISFSGSDNESASAWQSNIEEFKVFRSWMEAEKEYLDADCKKFEKFWMGRPKKTKVIDVPSAVKRKLIEIAPDNVEVLHLDRWSKKRDEIWKKPVELWDKQKEAVNSWLTHGGKGIFEMATGTGKTFAALGALEKTLEREKKLVVVIACPLIHLAKQWAREIEKFGIYCDTIIADSSNPNWKNKLADHLLDIENGINEKLIVLTTHATFPTNDFRKIIIKAMEKLFLVVDEVHGIGAPKGKEGLIEEYIFRLGLSATPKRWFDLEGTEALFKYFGDVVFEFSLKEAINNVNPDTGKAYLTPYEYKPYFVELTEEELQKYEEETAKIAKAYYRSRDEKGREEWFSLLCIKRQNIVKNATNKYTAFKKILDEIGEVKYCLVYCSPQQIDRVQKILNEKNIIQHKFTMVESTKPEDKYGGLSERQFLLQKFSEGTYQALVAMKCLDQGVDIPPARIAIMLSNSGNPREYIQRRGRVLRPFPGKEKAIIYDIIVIPTLSINVSEDFLELERKILVKELKRYKEFAYVASNCLECLDKIDDIEEKYKVFI